MKTFSKQSLKFELIAIYEEFIKDKCNANESLKNKAKKLYMNTALAGDLFKDKILKKAIDGLESIGWDFPKIGSNQDWKLTLNDAKEILIELKKI